MKLLYFPQIKAVHTAQHNNRKIFSKHFFMALNQCVEVYTKQAYQAFCEFFY